MKLARNNAMYLKGMFFVLFVDSSRKDVAILADALAMLSESRFTCTHVQGLDQALACLDTATFDAAVLDSALAEGAGQEILRQIRDRDKRLVIVLLAGPDQETLLANERALAPYVCLPRERLLRTPSFLPGVLQRAISLAKAEPQDMEILAPPPERRHYMDRRRFANRRETQMNLSQALQNIEQCLLAGPSSGSLEAWVAELQQLSDTAAPLIEQRFGRVAKAVRGELPYGADHRPSQLQAIRRRGRALLTDYCQFRELVNNAASEISGSGSEQPDFDRISGTLCKQGLSIILECRRHDAKLAASAQESAYWEDGGGG